MFHKRKYYIIFCLFLQCEFYIEFTLQNVYIMMQNVIIRLQCRYFHKKEELLSDNAEEQ